MKRSDAVVKKWEPLIETHFRLKNKQVKELLCFYCEWVALSPRQNELPQRLIGIKEKIDSFYRVNIVGKVYNPSSGVVEYKLEDGRFIPKKGGTVELNTNDLIELFGMDFIREIDPEGFRDERLNKLL